MKTLIGVISALIALSISSPGFATECMDNADCGYGRICVQFKCKTVNKRHTYAVNPKTGEVYPIIEPRGKRHYDDDYDSPKKQHRDDEDYSPKTYYDTNSDSFVICTGGFCY
jgi:hypothetical protein